MRTLLALLGLLATFAALACATPSALDVSVTSEVPCSAGASITVVGGSSLTTLPTDRIAAVSTHCNTSSASDADMGSVIVVPATSNDEEVAFAVMTRADGKSADRCLDPTLDPTEAQQCIVAKRQLRFLPHTELSVHIDLRLACRGVVCPADQTCQDGACIGANNPPPEDAAPPPMVTLGGTLVGLAAGAKVVVEDNGMTPLTLSANGPFSFPGTLGAGSTYAVTVTTQPPIPVQSCTVSNGSGRAGASDIVVTVTCVTDTFTVGGTVTGLAIGDTLVLQDTGGDHLSVTANGSFAFPTPAASGSPYDVTVVTNPTTPIAQTCTVMNGSGTVGAANVTAPTVSCVTTKFTVGGALSGLAVGDSVTLQDNGGDTLPLVANGLFVFATSLAPLEPYAVTILSNPASPTAQTCAVSAGSGAVGNGNVTSVQVSCGRSPPSCLAGGDGLNDCGANRESCCTSLEVPTGSYARTYSSSSTGSPIGQADPATVSGLQLDKYLVTVGRFRQFVNAWTAGYRPSPGSGVHTHLNGGLGLVNSASPGMHEQGWNAAYNGGVSPTTANLSCESNFMWTATPGSNETRPLNCENWYEAFAFCTWDGGFLPSEAEWEYVAAGGNQQLEYPWGSAPPGTGDSYAIDNCDYMNAASNCTIAPVGTATLGAGSWGQLDMAGELFEWTLDYDAPYVNPCTDCAYLTATPNGFQSCRGGNFSNFMSGLSPAERYNCATSLRSSLVGIRCARTP